MKSDFLILADSAQVVGDKLYTLGGGWQFVWVSKFPTSHQMAIAFGILVDWGETNRRHDFRLTVRNEDTHTKGFEAEGQFEQGRAPGIPAGVTQRIMLAVNFGLEMKEPGQWKVQLVINGRNEAEQSFSVLQRQ